MMKLIIVTCALLAMAVAVDLNAPLESDSIINAVNAAKTTWKAGRNFHSSYTKSYLKNLVGVLPDDEESLLPELHMDEVDVNDLPDTFDSRTQWANCKSIQTIRDQGPCRSDWAVAPAAAFSDRLCIASNSSFNENLAAERLLSCCGILCGLGCHGGRTNNAWFYLVQYGIPTGGDYNSGEGCQPYTLPECEHHITGDRNTCDSYGYVSTPKCQKTCYNTNYTTAFSDDIHKVKTAYNVKGEANMMKEIYTNGPIVSAFTVYEDLLSYKSGVYRKTTARQIGRHAVKVIGWGTEDGTPYWLAANSWNSDWGDKGLFKIRRGTDEVGFETSCTAGTPKV